MIIMSDKYYLTNLNELSQSINYPLQQTKRIKYLSFDISQKYIIFGATSGSIYVFQRSDCAFLKIIPSQFGSINQIIISHNEKQVAFSNQKGTIGIVDVESLTQEIVTTQLDGTYVTCFCWTDDDKELYCGDKKGNVSLIQFAHFMGRNMSNVTLHPILLLDSQIVQISDHKDMLLVSTLSKCVLCNTGREEFKQIGNRPRDGQYGACFINNPNDGVKIYCSRPGSRLWEADLEGNVQKTHQFKNVMNIKLSKVIYENADFHTVKHQNDNNQKQPIIPFQVLHKMQNKFLLIHDIHNIFVIDPRGSSILLWNNEIQNIHSIRIFDNILYIFTNNCKLFSVQVHTIYEYASMLLNTDRFLDCGNLIKDNLNYFCEMADTQKNPIQFSKLKIELERLQLGMLVHDIMPLLIINSTNSENIKKSSPTLENGIYILENLNLNASSPDMTIKEALVSVVRGTYGKNIKQMVMGLQSQQLSYDDDDEEIERNHQKPYYLMTDDDHILEDVVPLKIPPKTSKFSASLLNDYQLNEDDKIIRNLFLIYKSSTISNLNFLDRYSKIFDDYDAETIIKFLKQLEALMIENGEEHCKANCYKIYFDYLKVELIWEIDEASRRYIKEGFIEMNLNPNDLTNEKCDECGFYLHTNKTCRYLEIGRTLFQFYWSRKEYGVCFDITKQVPYMWRTICKFYIQERRDDKIVRYLWNLGSKEMFEKAVIEMYTVELWTKTFDLMILRLNESKVFCLNCDKCCSVDTSDNNASFYSWNYILSVATKVLNANLLLKLVLNYSDRIPKGSIDRNFYMNCILNSQ